ncbi:VOC family protein [Lederbergia wuyishanensis]|uniref:3-demethylubiquinone-9 3-methyltransferase (Glyoxalase superfamily) n=1 Tax=Lederbergia wuyishanensis TaxID=1347903 RepID=A0ABU0D2Q0_9BACI|nr:VOC family protein [Lederbergia wuyishanensis]MCJ8007179.1 VOC family protein [Lederbergia wuyishanensis]MDQ0342676.1 putative 3-demethylubiquinone-9 3-methyltransferase (glyoxalase superfamily) [Lederbergia wuyishanensis]
MQKIVPHLWYDKEAKEAAMFYISLFDGSKLLNVTVIEDTPSGDSELVSFELAGQRFQAISAGPYFKFNPSISLMVACETIEEVNTKWESLIEGGTELMPLGEYPFSKRYAWVQDRFGLSWQLMLVDKGQSGQKISPNLLFSNDVCGRAEEAVNFYVEKFENSWMEMISKYNPGEAESSKAKVNYCSYKLEDIHFSAMDNAYNVDYHFNEAFSFIVNCKDQEEIDYFWDSLSYVPEAEQCGWVKDKFGVSWQIIPDNIDDVLFNGSRDENRRVAEVLFKMKKIDLKKLENARLEKQ